MAERYGLSSENKGSVDAALDFPRLSLKKDEVARIAIFAIGEVDGKKGLILPEPEGAYVFGLENAGSGKYMGSYECLADEETKRNDGYDPDACPHCEAVQAGAPESVVRARKRTFALPVFRYNTKGKSAQVMEPLGGQVLAWRFTDRYFNTLVDEHIRWSEDNGGGLLRHDLAMKCEVEQWQNFKISVEPKAEWLSRGDEVARQVIATFAEALKDVPNGLGPLIGFRKSKEDLARKIEEALGGVSPDVADVPDLSEEDQASIADIASSMFGQQAEVGEAPSEAPSAAAPSEDVALPTTDAAEAVEAPSEAAGGEASGELDFDAFFK